MGLGTNYPGNPDATQAPSPAPGPGVIPTCYEPVDADGASWGNIAQDQKVKADFLAHIQSSVRLERPFQNQALSGFTAVQHQGTGTGTLTPSGNVKISAGLRFLVKMLSTAASGVATFQVSLDGGNTYGAVQTTAVSMTDATSGVTFAFTGNFVAGDTYGFKAAFTPQAQWTDTAGNGRFLIDHNGLPGGRIARWSELWVLSNIVAATGLNAGATGLISNLVPGWYYDTNATDAGWSLNVAGLAGSGLSLGKFAFSNVGTSVDAYLYPAGQLFDTGWANLCAVVDWYGALTPTGTTSIADHYMGLNGNPTNGGFTYNGRFTGAAGTGPMKDGVFFRVPGAGNGVTTTTIHCVTRRANTETDVDSGIAIGVNGTLHSFKIEIYGSALPGGAMARFFIDGKIITEITTNLPASIMRFAYGGHVSTVGSSGLSIGLGGLNAVWNLNDLSIPAL
jgi:hypothetical protein